MVFLKVFLIWVGVFILSASISHFVRKLLVNPASIKVSFIMSLILVPAILFGVLPLADTISSLLTS